MSPARMATLTSFHAAYGHRQGAGRRTEVALPTSIWRFPAIGSLAAEQREDREDAPVVVLAVRQPELLEDRLHVPFDGS